MNIIDDLKIEEKGVWRNIIKTIHKPRNKFIHSHLECGHVQILRLDQKPDHPSQWDERKVACFCLECAPEYLE